MKPSTYTWRDHEQVQEVDVFLRGCSNWQIFERYLNYLLENERDILENEIGRGEEITGIHKGFIAFIKHMKGLPREVAEQIKQKTMEGKRDERFTLDT